MSKLRTPLEQQRWLVSRAELMLRWKELKGKAIGTPPANPKFSLICPVYNVEKYIDAYFYSIVMQPEFLGQIEIIAVNDGSTDGSLAILNLWQRRFPNNITVVNQENGGLSAARNMGLFRASGTWVTYIDPDDFVARDYFARVNEFIAKHDRADDPLNVVACNEIIYREDQNKFVDNHPLNFRFKQDHVAPIYDMGGFIHMSAAKAFFRREVIASSGLEFDHRVRPHFEDGHLFIRLFSSYRSGRIGFVKNAHYYYRKRGDGSSLIDTSKLNPRRYDDLYQFGYIDAMKRAALAAGRPPRWAQRTVLYDIMWQVRDFQNAEWRLAFLSEEQLATYRDRIRELMSYIDVDTIRDFNLANATELHRVALLARYKNTVPDKPQLLIECLDRASPSFVVKWYSGQSQSHAAFTIDGQPFREIERKQQVHTFLGEPFVYEFHARFPFVKGAFSATLEGAHTGISGQRSAGGTSVDLDEALEAEAIQPPIRVSDSVKAIREGGRAKHIVQRYAGVWLLIDRDTQADDNAEHLYRYLMHHRPDIKAFFVLKDNSHDWDRLKSEGFNLMRFGGLQHKYALLNAAHVISSHADHYIMWTLPERDYGDLIRFKYVFLQHGVTKDDLSHWLNSKPMGLMITATYSEHRSIASDDSRYKFLPSQVQLTGFPRHDALLMKAQSTAPRRKILIMPTWREALVGKATGRTNARAYNPEFESSQFAQAWKGLLHSGRLKRLMEKHGYETVFFPHANIQQYMPFFNTPSHITALCHDGKSSIQDLFIDASIMITDLSSVAFEMAYLSRPVLYYQFDRDYVFSGGHLTRKGYFDYERDGFGPVCLDEASLLNALEDSLDRGATLEEQYAIRSLTTFKWRDGRCCERVVDAIEQLGAGSKATSRSEHHSADHLTDAHTQCWLREDERTHRLERELVASFSAGESGY